MPRKVNGFITLHRQILDWEWYKNINTKVLFLHLLLKANYKDLNFEGRKILRGQLVTSLASLSSELGLSVRQIRVSLDKLIMTGEVTSKSYNRYRIITIVKYDEYQNDDNQNDNQVTSELTSEWQADDKQMTSKWQADDKQMTTSKQYNNSNKGTMEQGNNVKERGKTAKRFVPPSLEEVSAYLNELGTKAIGIDPEKFIDYYSAKGWMMGKTPVKDWKACVRTWVKRDEGQQNDRIRLSQKKILPAQDFAQRDYSDVDEELKANLNAELMAARQAGII